MAGTTFSAALSHFWKSVTQTLLLATVLSASPALAENFVKVALEPDPLFPDRDTFYIDLDSFKPDLPTKSAYFTYRRTGKSLTEGKPMTIDYEAITPRSRLKSLKLY